MFNKPNQQTNDEEENPAVHGQKYLSIKWKFAIIKLKIEIFAIMKIEIVKMKKITPK